MPTPCRLSALISALISTKLLRRARLLLLGVAAATSIAAAQPTGASSSSHSETSEPAGVFRFHLPSEPQSLDHSLITSSEASYLFNNLVRGLYSFSDAKGLQPEEAESCLFKTSLKLECRLRNDIYWSDGRKVVAADYLRSFQKLLEPNSKTPSLELLKAIKNALRVHRGEVPMAQLGITAADPQHLTFEFAQVDPDFLFKLTASPLAPTRLATYPKRGSLDGLVFNGPYRVVSWTLGHRLRLESNPRYPAKQPRPAVEVLFIDDDQTALQLYEENTLSLLRRLPTTYIPKYRQRPDFVQIPVARFDYMGFGLDLKDQPELRKALSLSADYEELARIYDSLGVPGCPSLPEAVLPNPPCLKFDLSAAKAALAKVPPEVRERRLTLAFSKLGGDDVKKGMEWFQAQWKKNLGIQVDLQQMEQGVYLAALRDSPKWSVFRKGIGLERPTCLAALETLATGGSENFLHLDDPILNRLATSLGLAATADEKQALCRQGVAHLLEHNVLIPLGRIHFTLLANPRFQGWSLNQMNQLDLRALHIESRKGSLLRSKFETPDLHF